jgi:hypothetical protein
MSFPRKARRFATVAVLPVLVAGITIVLSAGRAEAMCTPDLPCPTLPSVNMQRVVLAATLDPDRADSTHTSGATGSVTIIEDALADKGYLARSAVDGYWGLSTTAAWGRWERHLGETSVWTNNGIPGLSELHDLAPGRFTLSASYSDGARTTFGASSERTAGNYAIIVNQRTLNMLNRAEAIAGLGNRPLYQGGYCAIVGTCADASAGTHQGGGTLDVKISDLSSAKVDALLAAMRKVGFAAWHRTAAQGFSTPHIHAVAINDYQMPWAEYGVDHKAPASITTNGWGGNCQILSYKFYGLGFGCSTFLTAPASQRTLVIWENV